MSITGDPDRPPAKAGMSIVDLSAGLFAVYGTLCALMVAQKTGEGQYVDVSLLDGQISFLNHLATGYFATGKPPGRMGSAHPSVVPYQAFRAKDMDFILAVANDGLWKKLCAAFDWEDIVDDPRFAKNIDRVKNREELISILSERFIQMEFAQISAALDKNGVPCDRSIQSIKFLTIHMYSQRHDSRNSTSNCQRAKSPRIPVKLSGTWHNLDIILRF